MLPLLAASATLSLLAYLASSYYNSPTYYSFQITFFSGESVTRTNQCSGNEALAERALVSIHLTNTRRNRGRKMQVANWLAKQRMLPNKMEACCFNLGEIGSTPSEVLIPFFALINCIILCVAMRPFYGTGNRLSDLISFFSAFKQRYLCFQGSFIFFPKNYFESFVFAWQI